MVSGITSILILITISAALTTVGTPMATTSAQIPNSAEPNKPLISVSFPTCTKLTPTNYQAWHYQISRLLLGFGLFAYLDGTVKPPPKTTTPTATSTNKDPQPIPNPAYETWFRQDQLILGALAGTLDPAVQPVLLDATTSHEAWTTLATTYANPSRGHILQLKDRLRTITHAGKTISEYMLAIKECTTQLAQLGKPVDAEDITSHIINGLDYKLYYPVIDGIRARDSPISFELFHEKLIQHELTLKNQPPPTTNAAFNPSAHAAYTRPYHHTHTNNNTRYSPSTTNNQSRPHQHNQTFYQPNSQNRGQPTNASNSNPFRGRCQYCRVTGHVISYCPDFKRDYPNVVFPPPPTRQPRPTAHTATTSTGPSTSYLIDSGASNHITSDLNTLAFHTPYDGPDDLVIGDGSSLSISHLGNQDGGNSA